MESTIDELGYQNLVTYDAIGNVKTITDKEGNVVTQNNYDELNRLSSTTDALNQITQYTYDASSNLKKSIEYLNDNSTRKNSFGYDKEGRITAATDADNKESKNTYDSEGNITSIVNPMDGVTSYTYDLLGRVTKEEISGIGCRKTYKYDATGLLSESKNARKQTTKYKYDTIGRLVSVTDELGITSYTYDQNGNVLTVSDSKGTLSREYDALDRVTKYTDYKGNTIQYSYDELGNLVNLTYPGGEIVRYEYYDNGTLAKVTDWDNQSISFTYDKNSRLKSISRPDSSVETYEYNKAGQVVSQSDVKGDTIIHSYTYDGEGNITKITGSDTDSASGLSPVEMVYNKANQLITYNGQKVKYDVDGNMNYGPVDGQMCTLQYDCRNRLIQAGSTTYEYDAENHRIAVNEENQRTEYVTDSTSSLSRTLVVTVYDKTADNNYETQGSQTKYVYGNGLLSEKSQERGYLLYHFNNLGSITALTNLKGKVVRTYSYGPYGEFLSGDTKGIAFLYNGECGVVTDQNGLYYMRARYYNVDTKRFLNQDVLTGSIVGSQSLNRYSYVQGNPISLTDPFGLCPWAQKLVNAGNVVLDLVGFVPGYGDAIDLIHAGLYLAQGDTSNAASCAISAIPLAGSFIGTGLKIGLKGSTKAVKGAKLIESVAQYGSNIATFARSGQGAMSTAQTMYDEYVVQGKSFSKDTALEAATLGLQVVACAI